MVNTSLKRRRTEAEMRKGQPKKEKKKVKRQKYYHSSDESGDENVATDAPKNYKAPRLDEVEESFEPSGANAVEPKAKPLKSALKPQPKHKATIAAKSAPADDAAHDSSPSEDNLADDGEEDDGEEDDDDDEDDSSLEVEADEFDIEDSDSDSSASQTSTTTRKLKKRNDPTAFATSITRILATKLTTTKRTEPILARSKDAQTAHKELADSKLSEKARRQLLAEKRAAREKGRVTDVLGLHDAATSTAAVTAKEKELRRTAQKGVIRLFNAVRAAQVKGEAAQQMAREQGVVGLAKREERVKEMSKQGFLDMITGGKEGGGEVEVEG
ncbi:Rrp15p-domain-containing protein [Lizonia empirigonia]|nr:Rrp15p-domain-containing protein [Lizonia empirigonia]